MPIIDYSPLVILILVVMAYYTASKFDDWFRKSRELDKQLTKTFDMSTGETVNETGLDDFYKKIHEDSVRSYEQYLERRDDISRRALITQEQYERLWIQGRDILGGAESHIKPKESKPKGCDVKDQFDGVP